MVHPSHPQQVLVAMRKMARDMERTMATLVTAANIQTQDTTIPPIITRLARPAQRLTGHRRNPDRRDPQVLDGLQMDMTVGAGILVIDRQADGQNHVSNSQ